MQVGQVNLYVPSRPPRATFSMIDSGPMSTSPQRGHVVRMVVMSTAVSVAWVIRLSARTVNRATLDVPFSRPASEIRDPVFQLFRLDDLSVGAEPQQQAFEPLESSRG